MGMFDGSYKQPIPKYARRVEFVTRLYRCGDPGYYEYFCQTESICPAVLYPALVQGNQRRSTALSGGSKLWTQWDWM